MKVNVNVKLPLPTPLRDTVSVEVQLNSFLNLALDSGEWSASRPGHFTPEETALGSYQIGGWLGPRARLDIMGKMKSLLFTKFELRVA